jgi:tetratricopeptide (TPR) repeat protein
MAWRPGLPVAPPPGAAAAADAWIWVCQRTDPPPAAWQEPVVRAAGPGLPEAAQAAYRAARAEWLLFLRAGEDVDLPRLTTLRRFLRHTDASGFFLTVEGLDRAGTAEVRLVRRMEGVRLPAGDGGPGLALLREHPAGRVGEMERTVVRPWQDAAPPEEAPEAAGRMQARRLLAQSEVALADRRYREALGLAEAALEADPTWAAPLCLVGEARLWLGLTAEAAQAFLAAVRALADDAAADPADRVRAVCGLGRVEEAAGRSEAALNWYRDAVVLDPEAGDACARLVSLAQREGRDFAALLAAGAAGPGADWLAISRSLRHSVGYAAQLKALDGVASSLGRDLLCGRAAIGAGVLEEAARRFRAAREAGGGPLVAFYAWFAAALAGDGAAARAALTEFLPERPSLQTALLAATSAIEGALPSFPSHGEGRLETAEWLEVVAREAVLLEHAAAATRLRALARKVRSERGGTPPGPGRAAEPSTQVPASPTRVMWSARLDLQINP